MPLYDDETAPAPPKRKPTQPSYTPPKHVPSDHTVNAPTGSRAYAGRNPALTSNPTRTPSYPSTTASSVLPYRSRFARTQQLAKTATDLLGNYTYLTNYWVNDIISLKKDEMKDRRQLAQEQYQDKIQSYNRKFDEALKDNRFNWIENHESPELNPDGWKKLVEKGPVDYSGINKRLEVFINNLQNTDRSEHQNLYDANLAFDRSIGSNKDDNQFGYLNALDSKRDARNKIVLGEADRKERLRLAMKKAEEAGLDAESRLAISKFFSSPVGTSLTPEQEKSDWGQAILAGVAEGAANLKAGSERNPLLDPIQNMGYAALEELRPKSPIEILQEFAGKPFNTAPGQGDDQSTLEALVDKAGPIAGPFAPTVAKISTNVNEALGNPVGKTLDMLSRPLNGLANAYDEVFAANDDEDSSLIQDIIKWTPLGMPMKPVEWLTGANPIDSVDDFFNDPSKLGDVGSGALEGFTNEYDGGFAKVIKNQAERDSEENRFDSERYQRWAGLGLDVVADPLNFVGVGLVTKPFGLAKGAISPARFEAKLGQTAVGADDATRRLGNELWSEYSRIPEAQRFAGAPRNVNEMIDLVDGTRANGYRPKTFRSEAERTAYFKRAKGDIDLLQMELANHGFTTNDRLASLKGLRDTTAAVKEAHVQEAGDWGYLNYLEEILKVKVDKGDMSPQALQELKSQMVTVPVISAALKKVTDVKGEFKDIDNLYDALGDDWAYGSGLTREETNEIARNTYGYLIKKDKTYQRMEAQIRSIKSRQAASYKAGRRNRVEVSGHKLSKLYEQKRMYQAAVLRAMFEAKRKGKVGEVSYKNESRAFALKKLREEAEARLEQAPVGYTNTLADRPRVDNDVAWQGPTNFFKDKGDEVLEGDMIGGHIRDTDLETGREIRGSNPALGMGSETKRGDEPFNELISLDNDPDIYKYLQPDFRFNDSHTHYQALIAGIDKALRDDELLNGAYGIKNLPDVEEVKMNLAEIPQELTDIDDIDAMLTTLITYDGVDKFSFNGSLDNFSPEVRLWGENLAEVMNQKFAEKYLREEGKIVRRRREMYVNDMMEKNWPQYAGTYDFKSGVASNGILPAKKNREIMGKQMERFSKDAEKKFGNELISTAKVHELRREAAKATGAEVRAALKAGQLKSTGLMERQFPLDRVIGAHSSPDEIMNLLEMQFVGQKDQLLAAKAKIQEGIDKNAPFHESRKQLEHINQQLFDLDKQIKELKVADKEARVFKKKVADEYAKRAMEHLYLTAARRAVKEDPKFLTLQAMGTDLLRIPTLGTILKNVDSEQTLNINMTKFKQVYNSTFAAPSKQFGEFADVYRNRTTQSARRIQINLEELKNSIGQYSKEQRIEAFRPYVTGEMGAYRGSMAQYDAIEKAFEPIVQAFKNPEKLGDFFISKEDINHFLNESYKLDLPKGTKINGAADIINAMVRHANKSGRKGEELFKDPFEVAWALRTGIEQARSHRSFMQALADTFGTPYRAAPVGRSGGPYADAMQALKKEHGWRSVDTLGRDRYLFSPESADLIEKMFKSLDPKNPGPDKIQDFVKMTDSVISAWKGSVTIYNPSYWIKNGIGEIYISWLYGVRNPESYRQAMKLVKHAKGNEKEIAALQSLTPLMSHDAAKVRRPSGVAFQRLKGQEKITWDRLLVAYHDQGLKTGFFDNDLKHNLTPTRQAFEDIGSVTRGLAKGHDKLRQAGEGYEDMLRMAHFIDFIKRSNKPFNKAVENAAAEVRKAHFDYDDFNDFEKTVMLRAFPFYKWTRKAAPMMMEMLFLKPGKVVAPYKIANATSNEITSTDMTDDPNGYMPNFSGMAPQFVRDMWAYQMDEGELDSYTNPPIPTMDLFKSLSNPGNLAYGMTTPLVKLPGTMIFDDNKSGGENLLEGLSPQTKWIDRANDEQGYTWQDWVTMLGAPTYGELENKKGVNFNTGVKP